MTKRPDGALEHDIMMVLWAAERPLQPGEIKDRLQTSLAYTSVATVLGRLNAKGLVARTDAGRAYVYEAVVGESELAARRLGAVLSSASDRTAVLAGFVGSLSKRDAASLRKMLGDGHR